MQVKHCLVTGASGFIGTVLCKALKERGIKIRAWLRRPIPGPWDEFIAHDFAQMKTEDFPLDATQNIDTVFHVAGIAHTSLSTKDYWKVNVESSEALLKNALHNNARRFIYFSSVKAIEAQDEYGRSKRAAEEKILEIGAKNKIQVSILRPALVYGENLKGNLLSMIKGIDQGWFPPPPFIQNQRSLIAVEDLVEGALCIAESPQAAGKIYNMADGQVYSTRELYEGIRKALGLKPIQWAIPFWLLRMMAKGGDILETLSHRKLPINSVVLEKLLGSAFYAGDTIQHELGWTPKRNFFKELPRIIDAYRR